MSNLPPQPIDGPLADASQVETWPAGRALFREGETPHGVYSVLSGEIDLVFSARNGASRTLRLAQPGDVLGLGDVLSGAPHDCTAMTRTEATIGCVAAGDLRRLLAETPSLWLTLLRFLSNDVEACYDCMRAVGAPRRHIAV